MPLVVWQTVSPLIFSASLYKERYLKNRLPQFTVLDRQEPMISRSKSNNAVSGSTSVDRMFGLSHKMRFAVPGPKVDMLTQFKSYAG
jgi:hypothetical protein